MRKLELRELREGQVVMIEKQGVNMFRFWENADKKAYIYKGITGSLVVMESYHGGYTETFQLTDIKVRLVSFREVDEDKLERSIFTYIPTIDRSQGEGLPHNQRINLLTELVTEYLQYNSTKLDNGMYRVEKNMFLSSLVDAYEVNDDDEDMVFMYSFLNQRINTKYSQTYHRAEDLVSREDFFSMVMGRIIEDMHDRDYVDIDFEGKQTDYISRLVFLIDKEVFRQALKEGGLVEKTKQEMEVMPEGGKYHNPFANMVYLDAEMDNGSRESDGETFSDQVSIDHVVGHTDVGYDLDIDELVDSFGLTKRQREVLVALERNNGNRTHTAEELGISRRNVIATVNRIKDRVEKNFGYHSIYEYIMGEDEENEE